jgi:hydroxymethylpyrimidine/phosphomethylpyrimidine kinase
LGVRLALNALRQVEVLVELFSIDYAKTGRVGTRYDLLVVTETLKYVRSFFVLIPVPAARG